ncbi:AtpZ/AtpI family protein [Parerythrobacter jejuensis]|uniref:ATP synthase protein I n=1 Tax=Parerythrobacter jejuensis TaxID=795812 RepID=A0A845AQQ0_9SPHN|nr:AtpZ/AtpI family protein [Parerythrobacter jejuensis]MXP32630.1 ATP-binding protein [Parerythrobacter jejuensis]
MSDEKPAREPIAEDARIDALEERLKAAREREEERNQPQAGTGVDANYRSGNRVLADLLGGILGGVVIGWAVDALTGTSPWGLLVGLFLGIIVAFRNIFRMANAPTETPSDEG